MVKVKDPDLKNGTTLKKRERGEKKGPAYDGIGLAKGGPTAVGHRPSREVSKASTPYLDLVHYIYQILKVGGWCVRWEGWGG